MDAWFYLDNSFPFEFHCGFSCGEWGMKAVPNQYKAMVQQCLEEYSGTASSVELNQLKLIDLCRLYAINR
ncbi:aminoglycoside adenylyltransferase domain-containing protein [Paenibacillus sp. OSY-SE]|uniref:aminoglycoside adenylyltransferase domain-containing protein n=1 Tax=Paenibacillus sp. OSY-SE TaxID=1196323 RepID=UPI00030F5CF1|nr:aminoglycoside adenylyltransferase domain-containing protein [Paenibacillus sp. OSY-SE]